METPTVNKELDIIGKDIRNKEEAPVLNTAQKTLQDKQVANYSQNTYDAPSNRDNSFAFRTTDVPIAEAYAPLTDGTYTRKFENFVGGTNNENRLAIQQGSLEKWGHGLSKLVGKTLTATVGGTAGIVNGVIQGISQGSFEATYNNNFNNWLDDLNTKMDYKLPNYYTEQEKTQNFGSSLGTANFWANDVLSGLSFTLGTLVSEGIWAYATGGGSLIAKGIRGGVARWGEKALSKEATLKAMNKFKEAGGKSLIRGTEQEAVEGARTAAIRSLRGTELANNLRFITTSAGYEAGVEARYYQKSTMEKWEDDFQNLNGRKPTPEERASFNNELGDMSNLVFATNVALVGASNIAQFGRILKGSPIERTITNTAFKNKVLGIGYETLESGQKVALKATKAQKVARGLYTFGRTGFLEGVVEEGGQGVISGGAEDFMLGTYDKDNLNDNIGIIGSMIRGFEDSFGTTEGQKAIGIGFIVGVLGGGANTRFRFNELSQEQKEIERLVDYSNKATSDIIVNRMKELSRMQNAAKKENKAIKDRDLVGEETARKEALTARAIRDIRLGGLESGLLDLQAYLEKTKPEEIADAIGVNPDTKEGQDAIAEYKSKVYNEYKDVAEETQKNLDYAEAIMGDAPIAGLKDFSTKDLAEQMAYHLNMGKMSGKLADDMVETLKTIVANNLGAKNAQTITVENVLTKVSDSKLRQLKQATNKVEVQQQRVDNLQTKVYDIQNLPNKEENQERATKLYEVNKLLLEATSKLETLRREQELAYNTSNIENLSNGEVTMDMLENQQANIKKLRSSLDALDPINKRLVDDLIDNYSNAVRQTKMYNSIIETFTNPKTRVNTLNGWLSSLLNKNKKLEEGLEALFSEVAIQHENSVKNTIINLDKKATNGIHPNTKVIVDNSPSQSKIDKIEAERQTELDFTIQKETRNEIFDDLGLTELKKVNTTTKFAEKDGLIDTEHGKAQGVRTKYKEGVLKGTSSITLNKEATLEVLVHEFLHDFFNSKNKTTKNETFAKSIFNTLNKIAKSDSWFSRVTETYGKDAYNESSEELAILYLTSKEFRDNLPKAISKKIEKWLIDNNIVSQQQLDNYLSLDLNVKIKDKINAKYDAKIAKLDNSGNSEGRTSIQKLEDSINDEIQGDTTLKTYIGDKPLENLSINKKDVDRYKELLSKISINPQTVTRTDFQEGTGLTKEETDEFKELNQKLNDWKTLDGVGIADKLAALETLKTTVDNENTTTKTGIDKIVIATQGQESEGAENSIKNVNTIITPAEKVAKFVPSTGNYELSHTNIEDLTDIIPGAVITYKGKNINDISDKNKRKVGNKFILTKDGKETKVTIENYSRLSINKEDMDSMLEGSPYSILDLAINSFMPIYQDGKPVSGSFGYFRNDGTPVEFNEHAVYSVKKDNKLTARIDLNDTYNQQLLDEYEKGNITKDELAKQMVIYTSPKGQSNTIVGVLRGLSDRNEPSTSVDALSAIRNEAIDKVINRESDVIDLEIEIPVDKVLLGNPNITLDENGQPITIKFSEKAIGQVLATGYVIDKKVFLNKDVNANTGIATRLSNRDENKGKKIPIIVFQYQNQRTAYPVNLIENETSTVQGAEEILDTSLNSAQKANEFARYLIANKIDPNKFGIDFSTEGWENTPQTQAAIDELSNIKDFADIETWLNKDFNPRNLIEQAEISVDITDKPLMSGKIIIKLEEKRDKGANLDADRVTKQRYKNKLAQDRINITEELSQDVIELERMFQDSSDLSNKDADSDFLMAMYDRDVVKNPASYIEHQRNVSILREMLEHKIPIAVQNKIGKDKINAIKGRIATMDKIAIAESIAPTTIQELTDEEVHGITMALTNLPFTTSDELLPSLMEAFYVQGEFDPSIESLVSSGLYNKFEAARIMNDMDTLQGIKELVLKLQVTEKTIENNFYVDDRFMSVGTELDVLGKQKAGNPYINEQEAIQLLGGIKDRQEFESALEDSDLDYLKESYKRTKGTKDDIFTMFEKYDRLPIKTIENGELVDKVPSSREKLEETLTKPTTNIVDAIDSVLGLNPITTTLSKDEVQNVVDKILIGLKDIGLDLSEQQGKSLEQLRPLLETVADFAEEQNETTFNNLVKEYDELTRPISETTKVVSLQPDLSGRDGMVYLDTNDIEYNLLNGNNLIKTGDNTYIEVPIQNVEDLYINILTHKEVLPEGIDNIQDLKNYVTSQAKLIERPIGPVEPEVLEKMVLYKMFYNLPINEKTTGNLENEAVLYEQGISNAEYLQSEFIGDFNKEVIDNKQRNTTKYNEYYNKFKIDENGITLISADPLTLAQIEPYLDSDMRDYMKITGQIPSGNFEGVMTRDIKRTYYLQNPKSLPIFAENYEVVNDSTIASKEDTDFIRLSDNRIYEATGNIGNYTFYTELEQPMDLYKSFSIVDKSPELNVKEEEYRHLVQDVEPIEVVNKYSKAVEETIDDELEKCD